MEKPKVRFATFDEYSEESNENQYQNNVPNRPKSALNFKKNQKFDKGIQFNGIKNNLSVVRLPQMIEIMPDSPYLSQ